MEKGHGKYCVCRYWHSVLTKCRVLRLVTSIFVAGSLSLPPRASLQVGVLARVIEYELTSSSTVYLGGLRGGIQRKLYRCSLEDILDLHGSSNLWYPLHDLWQPNSRRLE